MMDWQDVTYNTYVWFVGERYGMDLQINTHVDISLIKTDNDMYKILREDLDSEQEINGALNKRTISGHVITSAWHYDKHGKIVEYSFGGAK